MGTTKSRTQAKALPAAYQGALPALGWTKAAVEGVRYWPRKSPYQLSELAGKRGRGKLRHASFRLPPPTIQLAARRFSCSTILCPPSSVVAGRGVPRVARREEACRNQEIGRRPSPPSATQPLGTSKYPAPRRTSLMECALGMCL